MSKGLLVLYTGASGVGKGTIMKELMKRDNNIKLSISCTTRSPRQGETDGVEYYFVTKDKFLSMIDNNEFVEYAKYCDNYYGSPEKPIEEMINKGINVFLEIEVQGGVQILEKHPDCVSIFILPPSLDELERRLRTRGTETEEAIIKRTKAAKTELTYAKLYEYSVVNNSVDEACDQIQEILSQEYIKRNKEN